MPPENSNNNGGNSRKKLVHHEIPKNEGINMTPLIDVVFQLLIFFMVASSLIKPNQIELDLPESSSGTKAAEQIVVAVTYRISDEGPQIMLDDKPMADLGALGKAMREMEANQATQLPVDIRIDKAVPYQDVVSLIDTVRDAGFFKFSLLTLAGGAG